MYHIPLIAIAFSASIASSSVSAAQEAHARAVEPAISAEIRLSDGSPAGRVSMFRGPYGLLFRIEGENWAQGWHGAHLHAVGSCEEPAFQSAGGHVDHPQQQRPHGLLNLQGGPDHGDLQNVYAHADGTARAEVYVSHAGLNGEHGRFDMADGDGLSLVIHANADDHLTQPIGGAGARIACAVLANPRAD